MSSTDKTAIYGKNPKGNTSSSGDSLLVENWDGIFSVSTSKLEKKILDFYKKEIFPKVSFCRGSTKLKKFLERIAVTGISKPSSEATGIEHLEWDNVIILDGCRADLYEEVTGHKGSRVSVGDNSPDFIRKTFSDSEFTDTVLVTANPHFEENKFEEITGRNVSDVFHTVFQVWRSDWSSEYGTVLPEDVVKRARTAAKLFPDKRMIIWFMQPHHPFVPSPVAGADNFNVIKSEENHVWNLAEKGKVDSSEIWSSYKENLEYVLENVENLKKFLEGRIIITADHGNLVGEKGFYGHPGFSTEVNPLRKVPLEVIED